MREDLEMYFKQLKTAMVELINKDYADFVNLSTNLVSFYGWHVQDAAVSPTQAALRFTTIHFQPNNKIAITFYDDVTQNKLGATESNSRNLLNIDVAI